MIKKVTRKIKSLFQNQTLFPENAELVERFKSHKRCIILGSASSINDLDLTNFQDDFVISMGNFYEHPDIEKINPSIHIFAATHPPITLEVLTNWWTRCHEILPKNVPVMVEKRDYEMAIKIFINRKVYQYSYGGNLPVDFTKKIVSPSSVPVIAIQLGFYCQVPKIILIGVHYNWKTVDIHSHFYSHDKPSLEYYLNECNIKIAYEDKKIVVAKEMLYAFYTLYQSFEFLHNFAKTKNVEIFNGDPFSPFDVFPFLEIDEISKSIN